MRKKTTNIFLLDFYSKLIAQKWFKNTFLQFSKNMTINWLFFNFANLHNLQDSILNKYNRDAYLRTQPPKIEKNIYRFSSSSESSHQPIHFVLDLLNFCRYFARQETLYIASNIKCTKKVSSRSWKKTCYPNIFTSIFLTICSKLITIWFLVVLIPFTPLFENIQDKVWKSKPASFAKILRILTKFELPSGK